MSCTRKRSTSCRYMNHAIRDRLESRVHCSCKASIVDNKMTRHCCCKQCLSRLWFGLDRASLSRCTRDKEPYGRNANERRHAAMSAVSITKERTVKPQWLRARDERMNARYDLAREQDIIQEEERSTQSDRHVQSSTLPLQGDLPIARSDCLELLTRLVSAVLVL